MHAILPYGIIQGTMQLRSMFFIRHSESVVSIGFPGFPDDLRRLDQPVAMAAMTPPRQCERLRNHRAINRCFNAEGQRFFGGQLVPLNQSRIMAYTSPKKKRGHQYGSSSPSELMFSVFLFQTHQTDIKRTYIWSFGPGTLLSSIWKMVPLSNVFRISSRRRLL